MEMILQSRARFNNERYRALVAASCWKIKGERYNYFNYLNLDTIPYIHVGTFPSQYTLTEMVTC